MTPELETTRLLLKPLALAHAPDYTRHFVDYEVIRHLSDQVPWPYPEGGVEDFMTNVVLPKQGDGRWAWGIFLKSSPDELIGGVDLWRRGCPEHRGFWLGRAFWGNGYMGEACDAVTQFAFEDLNFEKLIFSNALGNVRSRRIKEKAGAQFVGLRDAKFVSDEYTQSELWELTRESWLDTREAK